MTRVYPLNGSVPNGVLVWPHIVFAIFSSPSLHSGDEQRRTKTYFCVYMRLDGDRQVTLLTLH